MCLLRVFLHVRLFKNFRIENKTAIFCDPDKLSEKYLHVYKQAARKFALNFKLNQGEANLLLNMDHFSHV